MSVGTTTSIVLSVAPYRESSILTVLFSREHGRISGIAKGIRRSDRRRVPVERGYVVEHVVYLRRHRDLQTVTDCSILEHFPLVRGDLERTAVRDLLFDVVLSSVPAGDAHPVLYDFLLRFLEELGTVGYGFEGMLTYLSGMLFTFAGQLGFGLDFTKCSVCGRDTARLKTVWLAVGQGLLRCDGCSSVKNAAGDRLLPVDVLPWYARHGGGEGTLPRIDGKTAVAAVRLAYDYCRYHLEIRKNLQSFQFVEHLAGLQRK